MLFENYQVFERKIISKVDRFRLNTIERSEISSDLNNSSILVLGAAGSIGSVFTKRISNYKFKKLILLDKNENDLTELNRDLILEFGLNKIKKMRFICSDITVFNINNMIKQNSITHLLNFSALKHVRSEEEIDSVKYMLLTNSDSFFNFKRNEKSSLRKIFSVSTDKSVYPSSILGISKFLMEQKLAKIKLLKKKVFVSTARFANVSFSNGSILKNIIDKIKKKKIFGIPNKIKRYYITHEEACSLCFKALLSKNNGYIIVPSQNILKQQKTIKKLCEEIFKLMKIKGKFQKKKTKIIQPTNKFYPVLISDGINHGQKIKEKLFYDDEEIFRDSKDKSILKIRLEYKINYKKVLGLMLKSNSLENLKKIIKKNIKFYRPVNSPNKISKTM